MMNTASKKTVARMSDMVIDCELRSMWSAVDCDVRHGVQPAKWVGEYVATLEAEKASRAAR